MKRLELQRLLQDGEKTRGVVIENRRPRKVAKRGMHPEDWRFCVIVNVGRCLGTLKHLNDLEDVRCAHFSSTRRGDGTFTTWRAQQGATPKTRFLFAKTPEATARAIRLVRTWSQGRIDFQGNHDPAAAALKAANFALGPFFTALRASRR